MPWIEQFGTANWAEAGWIALGAYALGCFTTGYYLVRMRTGQDIRDSGSGNVGAKNVGRLLGRSGFFLTCLGDTAKGAFAVWAAQHFTKDPRLVALSALAVVAGHIWPVQLFFRGGKGMATCLGALLVFDYHLVGAFLLFFAAGFAVLRKTVLPGLFAFACLPLLCLYLEPNGPRTAATSLLAAMVLFAHRKNLFEEITHFLERRNIHHQSK